jgi:mycothiol synthase
MDVVVRKRLKPRELVEVVSLVMAAGCSEDHRPLGEHKWLDLVEGGREGFLAVLGREPGHAHLVGYAQLSRGKPGSWAVEVVVHPHHRDSAGSVSRHLLEEVVRQIARQGGGHLHYWVPKPSEVDYEVAASLGLSPGRELFCLARPLPLPGELREPASVPRCVQFRPFVVGQDEAAWLELNNVAFAHHPEQGGWDMATLVRREAEPWFDPAGFVLAEADDGSLAGFCWTKLHAEKDPPDGELYVLAVAESWRGKGLGRSLMIKGIDYLESKGASRAILYVDASNQGAIALYRSVGFELDHVDKAFVADIKPAAATSRRRGR